MPGQERERARAPRLHRFGALQGATINAADGDVGSIEDAYFDDQSWTVRYLVADTGTWLSGRKVLISPAAVRDVDAAGGRVYTDLSRRQVQDSPPIDTAKPVSRQEEAALQSYYGYAPYWSGPYRWGPDPYPYALLGAGIEPPTAVTPPRSRVAEELAARELEGQDPHLHSARAVSGCGIRATDGDLGHVEDFLLDEQDWAIRYVVVDPRSWWPGPHVLVGTDWIRGVSWEDRVVEVDVSREAVRDAPRYEPGRPFGRAEETRLYGHHRRPGYWDQPPGPGMGYPPAA